MKAKVATQVLSDNAKIAIIFNSRPLHKEWVKGDLSIEEKRRVLEGMDIAIDGPWILGLIEDIRDLRRGAN